MDQQPSLSPASPAPPALLPSPAPPALPAPSSPASPPSPAPTASAALDPLLTNAAKRIADVINQLKRDLVHHTVASPHVHGSLSFALPTGDAYRLTVAPHTVDDEYAVSVQSAPTQHGADRGSPTIEPPAQPTQPFPLVELDSDTISRKRRKLGHDGSDTTMRLSLGENTDHDDASPLITKQHLEKLLAHLREDIQDDTSETVNYLQRLLHRHQKQWHQQSNQSQQPCAPSRNSMSTPGPGPDGTFPASDLDHGHDQNQTDDDTSTSIIDVVRRETALISRQIKWVEDCRRVANDVHVKREDTWRTSSAGFHDQQRQDRENFQNRMVHESAAQSQTLNQILNEVKAIGLYAQNLKWETPSYMDHTPNTISHVPTPPAFPTQQQSPAFQTQPAHYPPASSASSAQPRHLAWKTGRGPGTQNG